MINGGDVHKQPLSTCAVVHVVPTDAKCTCMPNRISAYTHVELQSREARKKGCGGMVAGGRVCVRERWPFRLSVQIV